jgi:uncharacterized protein
MSGPAGAPVVLTVDALQLARQNQTTEGGFEPSQLGRIADYLFSPKGSVQFRISGAYDERRRATLRCIITGYLELTCQRCLGPMQFQLATDSVLVVVPDEKSMSAPDEEDDEVDFIVAAPRFDVVNLIEDEIILSLPLAPRHAEGECTASTGAKQG